MGGTGNLWPHEDSQFKGRYILGAFNIKQRWIMWLHEKVLLHYFANNLKQSFDRLKRAFIQTSKKKFGLDMFSFSVWFLKNGWSESAWKLFIWLSRVLFSCKKRKAGNQLNGFWNVHFALKKKEKETLQEPLLVRSVFVILTVRGCCKGTLKVIH